MRERVEHIVGGLLRLEKPKWQELRGGDPRADEAAALEEGAS